METGLNPVQEAMSAENATQCGFCTPGFVVSMTGFCLSNKTPSYELAVAAADGNICRCTGYNNIVKAILYAAAKMRGEPVPSTEPEFV